MRGRGVRVAPAAIPRSLTARVVIGAVLVVTAVLIGGGLVIVTLTEQRDRRDADADLRRFAGNLAPSISGTLGVAPAPPSIGAPVPATPPDHLELFDRGGRPIPAPLGPPPAGQAGIDGVIPGTPGVAAGASVPGVARALIDAFESRGTSSSPAGQIAFVRAADAASGRHLVLGTVPRGMPPMSSRPGGRTVALARKAAAVKRTDDLAVRVQEPGQPREVEDPARELDRMLGRLEEAVATREAALLAARRFAADAGHELRTPLQSVRANLDIASSDGANAEQRRVALEVAALQSERLNRLVDGLQTLARGESGLVAPSAGSGSRSSTRRHGGTGEA